jgi:hypothetical protein
MVGIDVKKRVQHFFWESLKERENLEDLGQGFSTGVPRETYLDKVKKIKYEIKKKKEKLKFPLPTLLTCIRVDILYGEGEPHKKSWLISWPK